MLTRLRSLDQRTSPRLVAAVAVALLALLPAQAWSLAMAEDSPFDALSRSEALTESGPATPAALAVDDGAAASSPANGPSLLSVRAGQEASREEERDPADDAFAERWPAQADARQDVRQPDTTRWALLIGINEQMGSVRDNVGSAQDAQDLAEVLRRNGWRDDHIVVMTDLDATRDNILAGMRWLARKTTADSVAIFHYSGHSKKWYGQDHDGDGEVTDEGLWPTDDGFIVDSELVANLAGVDAGNFWVSIGACNAEGFNDPGLARPGRLLTFSSTEAQKSYEDPSVHNSVWGYYFVDEAMLQGYGDTDGDGEVTIEEAFDFAKPRAATRTEGQKYGRQDAVMVDQVDGAFSLRIPPPPPEPEPEPSEPESNEGGLLCPVVCDRTVIRS